MALSQTDGQNAGLQRDRRFDADDDRRSKRTRVRSRNAHHADAVPASTFSVSGTITGLTGSGLGFDSTVRPERSSTQVLARGRAPLPSARSAFGNTYRVSIVGEPAAPTQLCFFTAGAVGTIVANDINVAINCINSASYTASGAVSGLTGSRLVAADEALQLRYRRSRRCRSAAGGERQLCIPYRHGSGEQRFRRRHPHAARGTNLHGHARRAFSVGPNITTLGVTCVNNATDPLSGTYSFLDQEGRGYVSFNADGTFTTALIHNSPDCNAGNDTRNGNGVEYGDSPGTSRPARSSCRSQPVVDTNGGCGFGDASDFSNSFSGFISRVGQTIVLRETAGGPVMVTATAVESNPGSLVGAFVPDANNGHAAGLSFGRHVPVCGDAADGLFPLGYGQERGCYSVSGSVVTMTFDASCRPDGLDAYDLNGDGGIFPSGVTSTSPLPFTLNDANTLAFLGNVFKRTQPN